MFVDLTFNMLLEKSGVSVADVRLLRHADRDAVKELSVYELWRCDRPAFDMYQSIQSIGRRNDFGNANFWASFAAISDGRTIFLGLYKAKFSGLRADRSAAPHEDVPLEAGDHHLYELVEVEEFSSLGGKLLVDWGPATRSWIQRADNQDKKISELRLQVEEPSFPGFINFIQPLSRIARLPQEWKEILRASRGIYLLTCPRTKEQYVGKADGAEGFFGRWSAYVVDGHGGNLGLKSRQASDYQISVLEVAGSCASSAEISAMESLWKRKLQSCEMGLNHH